jgi:site-specific DNA recombinase
MGKRVGLYKRISDDREGRELGVGRQGVDCRAMCERDGDVVVDEYCDNDISASTRTKKIRPDYQRLLADARAGRINKIVAYTSGRLTRRPRENEDQIDLAEQHGVEFKFVASPSFDLNTAMGRRIARILAANDAGEAEDTSERVSRERLDSATAGVYLGGPRPYGYESDGVTVRKSEAENIKEMVDRLLAGDTLYSIAADLNRRGELTSRDKPWRVDSITQILRRPRHAGLSTHQGEVVGKAVWPAILDEATWRAVVALLDNPARRTAHTNSLTHLGAGLYLCGRCGAPMRSCRVQGGWAEPKPRPEENRKRKRAGSRGYRCSETDHLSRIADPIDLLVGELVIERLSREDAIELLDDGREDLAPLHVRLTTVRAKLDELVIMHSKDEIDGRQLALGSKDLRQEKADLEERIAAAAATSVLTGLVGAANVRSAWESTPPSRRQSVLGNLMTVTVLPGRRGRRPGGAYFDPDEIGIDWLR